VRRNRVRLNPVLPQKRRRTWGLWAVLLLAGFLALVHCSSLAQVDTGAIVGTVQDASGANIPDATVTVTVEATGRKQATQTGPDGSYILSPLKLGAYTLTAEKQGFKTTTQEHIQVTIQARLEINPKLEIGSISQNVEVTSSGPILDTQSSSLQQLVGQRAIDKLPLNGRNAVFLAQLAPGVTIAQNDSRGLQASGSFTANGARRTQNDYLLDGMDDNVQVADLVNQSQFVVLPPPDALREFTVQTNDYSAEFGHSAGAVLNLTTKSGSTRFMATCGNSCATTISMLRIISFCPPNANQSSGKTNSARPSAVRL
jgi:hypothetical protein